MPHTAVDIGPECHDLPEAEAPEEELPAATEVLEEPLHSCRDSVVDTKLEEGDVPARSTLCVVADFSFK